MKRYACALALLLWVAGSASADVIDTTTTWNRISSGVALGVAGTATMGQTFTADAGLGTQLDSFTFYLASLDDGATPTPFAAYVAAWDGTKVSGPMLYQSEVRYLPAEDLNAFKAFRFDTGGVQLTDGQQYVAFLSLSEYYTGSAIALTGRAGEYYAGGNYFFQANGSDFAALSAAPWMPLGAGDAAFVMTFSDSSTIPAVPEPSSICLLATGIGLLGRRFRHRTRNGG